MMRHMPNSTPKPVWGTDLFVLKTYVPGELRNLVVRRTQLAGMPVSEYIRKLVEQDLSAAQQPTEQAA
jgi:hypothetical protein